MRIKLPLLFSIDVKITKNPIQRVLEAVEEVEVSISSDGAGRYKAVATDGREILILAKGAHVPKGSKYVVRFAGPFDGSQTDLTSAQWLKHPQLPGKAATAIHKAEISNTLASWREAFNYIVEDRENDIIGLRSPQMGALHAVHAHWSTSSDPATIVMPTGTGKTETMLAILVSTPCERVLVVVPTDALRTQLAEKFLTLGILKHPRTRVLESTAERPIVCTLEHMPKSVEEVDDIFEQAHVIVTTSSIAGRCSKAIQQRIAHHCPYLFIDEAHHAEAPTWRAFKDSFSACKVLQFTATPFREDGKALDGKFIYKYPLRKAQEEGYFKPIKFVPVRVYLPSKSDAAIAEKAIEQLRKEAHLGHILMARVYPVSRANEVFQLYERYTEFDPIQLHSGIPPKLREENRRKLLTGRSKIVICVDMLGEGFDLPELKIAAFHDVRKSLAVTLQLAGRFTRSRHDLGDATFIANVEDVDVKEELRKLYSRDPDWNALLPELSERMIGAEQSFQDYLQGFKQTLQALPLPAIRPAMSMVAYLTDGHDWHPENFTQGLLGADQYERVEHDLNAVNNTLVIVTLRKETLAWADTEALHDLCCDLYVVVWSPEQQLLYINSSSNAGNYRSLAEALCGDEVRLIKGTEVFRVFHGIERLRLQNVGLSEQLGRNVRYVGRMGSDVEQALPEMLRRNTMKTVLAGSGFEGGSQVSVGASRKGRIWSHRRDRLDQMSVWCKSMGAKLTNAGIDSEAILRGTLRVTHIATRPQLFLIGVDWPEDVYTESESMWSILIDDTPYPLSEISIVPTTFADTGPLAFRLEGDGWRIELESRLFLEDDIAKSTIRLLGNRNVRIQRGGRGQEQGIEAFLEESPPKFWFSDGSSLEGCEYVQLRHEGPAFRPEQLVSWDWTGVDITQESQGPERNTGTIQAHVVQALVNHGGYDVIVDDDGSGEAADVVGIRVIGGVVEPHGIEVELYHCKYSQEAEPGQRVADLYEVCGQAQKSIHWMYSPEKSTDLMKHLLRRNARRLEQHTLGRIQVGDVDVLQLISEISRSHRVSLKVFIVQPGLSKANVTPEQLALLAVTENYLWQTYQIPLVVITSA